MKWHRVKHVQLPTNWQKNPIYLTTCQPPLATSDLGKRSLVGVAAAVGNSCWRELGMAGLPQAKARGGIKSAFGGLNGKELILGKIVWGK